MGKMIDADICLNKAWQNFYKQEDEHEKNIDDYDIMRDRFYEQSGFECCQQTIVNAPTVEAIPKVEVKKFLEEGTKDVSNKVLAIVREDYIHKSVYEARLKADMVAMLEEIQLEIEELDVSDVVPEYQDGAEETKEYIVNMIEQKIISLKAESEPQESEG